MTTFEQIALTILCCLLMVAVYFILELRNKVRRQQEIIKMKNRGIGQLSNAIAANHELYKDFSDRMTSHTQQLELQLEQTRERLIKDMSDRAHQRALIGIAYQNIHSYCEKLPPVPAYVSGFLELTKQAIDRLMRLEEPSMPPKPTNYTANGQQPATIDGGKPGAAADSPTA